MAAYSDTELESLMSDMESDLVERKESASDLPFDLRPATGSSGDDLDLDFTRNQYLPNAVSPQVLDRNEFADNVLMHRSYEGTNTPVRLRWLQPRVCTAVRNLGPTLDQWRQGWLERRERNPLSDLDLPSGGMRPIGYVRAVRGCYHDFRALAREVARRCAVTASEA